jgi:uncharacterized protein YydD (DUF2326 family)
VLIEIRADVFRKGLVKFQEGLNVVLGDENATNSIGKSSLLMIVDFAFGGGSLLEYNKDLVDELKHHYYFFTFVFEGETCRFRRGTNDPELVYRCSEEFTPDDAMDIEDYRAFLKAAYAIGLEDISFRSLVGLYMRVWGKENHDVHRPLHIVKNQSASECVNNLIKTFDKYEEIRALTADLSAKEDERAALQKAFRNRIVPKIGKREHQANAERIAQMELEIEEIKVSLAKFAANIGELVNREVLELKVEKDRLLASKLFVESKLVRIRANLQNNKHIRSKHFEGLTSFFPEVNSERLAEVEEFHGKLVGLLRSELKASERELQAQLERVTAEISEIDLRLGQILKTVDQPAVVVDRVYNLANNLSAARNENHLFDTAEKFKNEVRDLKDSLSSAKEKVLDLVQRQINDELRRIVTLVYGSERKSPRLELRENSYSYEVYEDTGTGTAYAALVAFDLAVFLLTALPAIAHDSFLYKNIENDSVARLFKLYAATGKQSFVAIDEIEKYGMETIRLLKSRCVLQLSNEEVLFIKDWRKR